jgi:hypothetical protein
MRWPLLEKLLLPSPRLVSLTPLVREWTGPAGERPPPQRWLRPQRPLPRPIAVRAAPRFAGLADPARPPHPEGFDFSGHMHRLITRITEDCPDFAHVEPARLLVTITGARHPKRFGLQAKVTPLRFRAGRLVERRRGRLFQVQRFRVAGVELLYLITFCLPRYLNQSFEQKLTTVFHELFHIAPEFNGDLRRHHGRYCIHTASKKGYDARMQARAEEYLKSLGPAEHLQFLKHNFEQLHQQYGGVRGLVLPMPKLVAVE